MSAEIIPFPQIGLADEYPEIDLMTAVDVALRDLSDVALAWGTDQARSQMEECRRLLLEAYQAARLD